jgi:hypothetical protein
MQFGVREICEVVLKAKSTQRVGNRTFFKHEPVLYFDSLKTSSLEGAATTVYAQGGRGNSRLIAWEGERTLTFTMEDALLSPESFMILSGAGLVEASTEKSMKVHQVEQTDDVTVTEGNVSIKLKKKPYVANDEGEYIFVMPLSNGEVVTEPYLADVTADSETITIRANGSDLTKFTTGGVVLVDYYSEEKSGVKQIEITPDKFGGNYYLEASTLFRDTNGVDMPAEFIIPNCKIQSNFTFTMASSGDPSSFTFTMDAFPDYTRFDPTKKVLATIQVVGMADTITEAKREKTATDYIVKD